MLKRALAGAATAIALIVAAPCASADVPDEILANFIEGFIGAFGSSDGGSSSSKQTSTIYPDFTSCNRAAAQARRQSNVRLAECNPIGGASTQYQLIVMTR